MKLKILFLFIVTFSLISCSRQHNWLEVGQTYKADFSGKYQRYYDIYFQNKVDNKITLEIVQFGDWNFGLVAENFFNRVLVNNIETDFIYTQAPFFTKDIYVINFVNNFAKVEIELNTSDFNKICIEDTMAVDWTDLGSFDAITIHTN